MTEAFFRIGSQNFHFLGIIGSLAIIIGFALLINAIVNSSDSWKSVKDYETCVKGIEPDMLEYYQMRLSYCQDSFYKMTGVQLLLVKQGAALSTSQKAEVLLNSIMKICFAMAVIFFGVMIYRPFPGISRWHHQKHAHHKK